MLVFKKQSRFLFLSRFFFQSYPTYSPQNLLPANFCCWQCHQYTSLLQVSLPLWDWNYKSSSCICSSVSCREVLRAHISFSFLEFSIPSDLAELAVGNGGNNTAFHTQCRTQTSFSLLAAFSAANSSAFQLLLLHRAFTRKARNKCPQNTEMHILFSAYLYEVLEHCQVFYLHFVTCEKVHCKCLSLTGMFIMLDFCNRPAIAINHCIQMCSSCSCSKPAENPPAAPHCTASTEACRQMEQNNLLFPSTVWSPKQPGWIRGF